MSEDTSTAAASWESLAAALATNPPQWQRLLTEHLPTSTRHCRACTTGGTGMRATPWPCGPQRLAHRAREIHRGRSA